MASTRLEESMIYRTLTAILVGAALIIGCTEQNAPTEPQDALTNPTFNFSNAPDFSGIVTRGEHTTLVTWIDPEKGWRVGIGADPTEICVGIFDYELRQVQNVNLQDERIKRLSHGDDMYTTVWDFTAFDCTRFLTEDPLASGVSDVRNTDNDLDGIQSGENHANAWGWSAHGILTRPSGASVMFNAHFRGMYNTHGGRKTTAKIDLR
jgi:hypothetical protein